MNDLFAVLAGYLLGSISFAILSSKMVYRQDIRRYGSGNAGMTNTLRTYGKRMAALVFVGDFLKGMTAVGLGWLFAGELGGYLAAFGAVIGHLFPVYFKFKGGKGVCTTAGAILMLCPPVFLMLVVVFIMVVAVTRYVSLGSVVVAALFPFLTFLWQRYEQQPVWEPTLLAVVLAALVIYMHRSNIRRLIRGEENRLGQKKPALSSETGEQEAPKPENGAKP